MKGIVLAGGTGSRLFPLTKVLNKQLLPVGNKPIIYYPIEKLCEAGLHEILIVTGPEDMGAVASQLGSGKDFGCAFTYKVQDEAGGIAQALGLAESFAERGALAVILGDNVFEDPLAPMVQMFESNGSDGALVALAAVDCPERFGVAEVEGSRILRIEEKPQAPKSDLAVAGIYIYDRTVYDIIRRLKPSARGEFEITDVNNHYIRQGRMRFHKLQGWWIDAGSSFESLARASRLVSEWKAG